MASSNSNKSLYPTKLSPELSVSELTMGRCGDHLSTLCPPQALLNPFPTCVCSLSFAGAAPPQSQPDSSPCPDTALLPSPPPQPSCSHSCCFPLPPPFIPPCLRTCKGALHLSPFPHHPLQRHAGCPLPCSAPPTCPNISGAVPMGTTQPWSPITTMDPQHPPTWVTSSSPAALASLPRVPLFLLSYHFFLIPL